MSDIDKVAVRINNEIGNCHTYCKNKQYTNHLNADVNNVHCCEHTDFYYGGEVCSIGNGPKGDPWIATEWNDDQSHKWPTYQPLQCIYDREKIDSLDQVKKSITLFGENNAIVNAFCQTKTKTCPVEMKDGCSRYFSTGPDGDYCRQIFNELSDSEKDAAISNYCSRYSTDDCKCANRSFDKDYLKLKQGNPFSDACWYIPCANSTRYLVPSEFKENPDCPANICQIVFDISQAHDVDIDHVKSEINCNFSGGKYPKHSPFLWYYIGGIVLSLVLLLVYGQKK